MPKSSSYNPVDEHRRKQRKKELLKNKQTRISARDEQVKAVKTVDSVKEEIRELEKRKGGDASTTKKLERLRKELKLVQEVQKEKQQQPRPAQQPLSELDDPRKSIYYDAFLNPYGAPPPGKPRVYHQRGGGTTMNVKLAVVPGEEGAEEEEEIERVVPPPPPPPQPRAAEPRYHHDGRGRPHPVPPRRDIPPPPPPKQQQAAVPPPPPPPPLPKEAPPPISNDPPALPPPSRAVLRSKKKRMMNADIWASTDEVEYEKVKHNVDLESGVIEKKILSDEWYYRDNLHNAAQGPFTTQQMLQWMQAGFFPPQTPVRNGNNEDFQSISQIDWNAQARRFVMNGQPQQQHVGADRAVDIATAEQTSVEDRIAALRQERLEAEEDQQQEEDSTIEDRIAALRRERIKESSVEVETVDEQEDQGPQLPPPPLVAAQDVPTAYPVHEDLEPPPAYYPLPEELEDGDDDAVGAYPTDLAYPVTDEYPMGDEETPAVGPYPTDEDVDAHAQEESAEPPKKVYKADKEVVGLLPTNLRKRRAPAAKAVPRKTKKVQPSASCPAAQVSQSVGDDYEAFMKDISALK